MRRCLIVGGSAAGMRAAADLVAGGYDGSVTVVDADPHAPYDRTVLSTGVLTGVREAEDAVLDVPNGVELLRGIRAHQLDTVNRTVRTDVGDLSYTELILATGGVASLPDAWRGMEGVFTVRSLDDVRALKEAVGAASRVAVVGGGVLGMEIATSLVDLGSRVEVIEAADLPLGRVLPAELGRLLRDRAASHGVTLTCGVSVESMDRAAGVSQLTLSDGRLVTADVVVVALGNRPATGWLAGSGLTIEDGVVCDERLRAGAPGVWAAGDLARVRDGGAGSTRSEHWTRAGEHGAYVARSILLSEDGPEFSALSYVWTDVLGTRIQVLGTLAAARHVLVRNVADDDQLAVLAATPDGAVSGAAVLGWQRLALAVRRQLTQGVSLDELLGSLPPHRLNESSMSDA
ncbi:NAD(P)/FAD-dependent oxidoreductase [Rhodococcus wratislaviensis]|uniref:Putative ferredoxin reductase n=1 Tax=Rhodococcus wratislaviensis NBRC 100605 TaxID=1219028 RepID=X0PUL4_RHOWR|nr:FAD-dependent oxidoreductase [Rhodococcus wratislaviensis]GAF46879.1 putative ferredoxin reductase [Rhodococcus wratislaviensis NBRC 100605]